MSDSLKQHFKPHKELHRKRIICPECNGEKEMMYPVEFDEQELQPCRTCGGKGMMIREVVILYERIPDSTLEKLQYHENDKNT